MAEWIKEEAMPELRWRKRHVKIGWLNTLDEVPLQQKWKITRGGTGDGVKEIYEWRDVPVEKEDER